MNKKCVSVFIPVYNEELIVRATVLEVYNFLLDNFGCFELFVVDDGSTDSTPEILDELKNLIEIKYMRFNNGPTRRENLALSFKEANYDIVVFIDVDLAVDLVQLPTLIERINHADITIGSRYIKEAQTKRSIRRLVISLLYNNFIRLYYDSKIKDHQCGFKAFKKEVLIELTEDAGYDEKLVRGWFWDAEILIRAQSKGYRVVELPVNWRSRTMSSFNLWRELKMVPYVLRLRWKMNRNMSNSIKATNEIDDQGKG